MGAILRSAARARAGSAGASTEAHAAVLAHSDILIPNTYPALSGRIPLLGKRHRRTPPGGPSTHAEAVQISEECGANATDSHSRRLFSQSSRYLRAMARSVSLACASALVYTSVIQVSSGVAASLAMMSQNSPSAAWRETSSPLNSMLPSSACARWSPLLADSRNQRAAWIASFGAPLPSR